MSQVLAIGVVLLLLYIGESWCVHNLVPRVSPLPAPSLAPGGGKRGDPGNEVGVYTAISINILELTRRDRKVVWVAIIFVIQSAVLRDVGWVEIPFASVNYFL